MEGKLIPNLLGYATSGYFALRLFLALFYMFKLNYSFLSKDRSLRMATSAAVYLPTYIFIRLLGGKNYLEAEGKAAEYLDKLVHNLRHLLFFFIGMLILVSIVKEIIS